jgi:hypothetical protein
VFSGFRFEEIAPNPLLGVLALVSPEPRAQVVGEQRALCSFRPAELYCPLSSVVWRRRICARGWH